jgi:7-cyano-7-deazaguanine synthase
MSSKIQGSGCQESMMSECKNNALILLSGGIDSVCLISHYLERDFQIVCLWVDYNQVGKEHEEKAVEYFCKLYRVDLIKSAISNSIRIIDKEKMEYQGRNLLLIALAVSLFPFRRGLISTGIRYSSQYYDCQEKFIIDTINLVETLSSGLILLDTPFYSYSKKDILSFAFKHSIDIKMAYSCIEGQANGCGNCVSCKERKLALEEIGIDGSD